MKVKTIAAAKLKERGLGVLEEGHEEGVVITRRGKPVAKLIPWPPAPAALIGTMKGRIRISGDILSTGERWDAES